jgi:hypothetical protein
VDEGWKFRKQIQWHMAVITNLTFALMVAGLGLSVHTSIATAAFLEEGQGHRLEDFVGPVWDGLVKVCLYIYQLGSGNELILLVLWSIVRDS